MSIDSVIVNPGRLRILTALAAQQQSQEFVRLRDITQMTDGNLATHARRLKSAGLVEIDKSFRDGKPVTTFTLTRQGRNALQAHVNHLIDALQPAASTPSVGQIYADSTADAADDNWID